jgi:hypothetical protein
MVAVAKQYGEVGRENEARWLLNMAQQLTGILKQMQNGDFNLSENDHENYFQFIVHILQLVEQNPTPENLYPYLNQNLSKLNETFHQILIDWINNILQDGAKSQVLQRFGIIIMSFGELLSNFSLGIAHINKEIVITCYQTGLRIFSKDTIPEMWAVVQDRLGIAYLERIQGNKSENLRIAINSFKNALTNDSRRTKSLYFRNKFKRFNGDIRKTWTTIKHVLRGNNYKTNSITLLNNNVQVSDFGKVAGIFNDYFSSVAVNLDHNIPQSNVDPLYYLPHRNSNSMFATPSTINEVAAAITGLPLKGCNSKSNHRASLRTYLIYCPQ